MLNLKKKSSVRGVDFIVSDDHKDLTAAIDRYFQGSNMATLSSPSDT